MEDVKIGHKKNVNVTQDDVGTLFAIENEDGSYTINIVTIVEGAVADVTAPTATQYCYKTSNRSIGKWF